MLAAASPAYGNGRLFVTLLSRGKRLAGRGLRADPEDGKILWKRLLPSRSESSPLFDNDRIYLGSENGTVYSMRAGDGAVRWKFKASGAVKSGLALANGKLFFGDYGGRVYAIRQADGGQVWATGTKGGKFGLRSGQFYSTPAVAYGRVYIGNTDGKMYSFASSNGKLAWTKGTGSYVYSSPAVAQVPGMKPTVYFGSYDGKFYALDARTGKVRVVAQLRRQDLRRRDAWSATSSTSPTTARRTRPASACAPAERSSTWAAASFNPVISDGRTIFLTGYSSLYALRPEVGRIGKPAALSAALTSGMRVGAVVEDRGGQDGVGARLQALDQVLRARRRRLRRSPGRRRRSLIARVSVELVAVLGAVAVHAGEQDLARAALDALARPRDRVAARRRAPAGDVGLVAAVGAPLGVDREHDALRAEDLRQLVDQLRAGDRGGVDRDLVGARVEHRVGVLDLAHAAADRERDEDVVRGAARELHDRRALVARSP